jgi:hypothetical protein
MAEGQSMTTVADVVAQVRDGRLENRTAAEIPVEAPLTSVVGFAEEPHPARAIVQEPARVTSFTILVVRMLSTVCR